MSTTRTSSENTNEPPGDGTEVEIGERKGGKDRGGEKDGVIKANVKGTLKGEPDALSSGGCPGLEPEQDVPIDLTRLYLNEIGGSPLLTAEQELVHARRAREGDADSKRLMIESNLRLVVTLAKRYLNRGLELLDLIEEGNLGLIRAVDKFNPDMGYRFSTYASWWIKQNMERALINQTRTIRLPIHVTKDLNVCRRAKKDLAKELDREPSVEEIATRTGKSVKRVRKLLKLSTTVCSADTPMAADSDLTFMETITDSGVADPLKILQNSDIYQSIDQWLSRLSRKQYEIVTLRFGLKGRRKGTLDDVGKEVGLTRERVRQIQTEALTRLRRMLEREGITKDDLGDLDPPD